MKNKITPKLNTEVNTIAAQIYVENNGKTKKDYDKAYNEAIKRTGYNPAYFKRCMSKIGPDIDFDL